MKNKIITWENLKPSSYVCFFWW